jgi:hypothetical protein
MHRSGESALGAVSDQYVRGWLPNSGPPRGCSQTERQNIWLCLILCVLGRAIVPLDLSAGDLLPLLLGVCTPVARPRSHPRWCQDLRDPL